MGVGLSKKSRGVSTLVILEKKLFGPESVTTNLAKALLCELKNECSKREPPLQPGYDKAPAWTSR